MEHCAGSVPHVQVGMQDGFALAGISAQDHAAQAVAAERQWSMAVSMSFTERRCSLTGTPSHHSCSAPSASRTTQADARPSCRLQHAATFSAGKLLLAQLRHQEWTFSS